jgi:cardiolipin synthase
VPEPAAPDQPDPGDPLVSVVPAEEAAGAGLDEQGLDRIATIPNLLTLVRLLCIPLFLWLLFGREDRAAAAMLLGALGATDWVDGYVARHFDQVSTLGKVLDPTADRILLIVAIGAIIADGSVPVWLAVAVLTREILVAGVAIFITVMGAARIDVTWVGKAGTFCNMFAFPLFLGGESTLGVADALHVAAWAFALPGLVLSYYAAAGYVPLAAQALREGRAGRAVVDAAEAAEGTTR